jgi:hypothetical protein
MSDELLFDGWPCDIPMLMRRMGPVEFAWMILREPERWSWGVPDLLHKVDGVAQQVQGGS